jgi:hypothetical protein
VCVARFEQNPALPPPAATVDVRVDPRVREQEWGTIDTKEEMERIVAQRERVGRFFFRFPNGESGAGTASGRQTLSTKLTLVCIVSWLADVYDRASSFLTVSLFRCAVRLYPLDLPRVAVLQSLYRQMDNVHTVKYDTIVIVAHGLFNRLFLMR